MLLRRDPQVGCCSALALKNICVVWTFKKERTRKNCAARARSPSFSKWDQPLAAQRPAKNLDGWVYEGHPPGRDRPPSTARPAQLELASSLASSTWRHQACSVAAGYGLLELAGVLECWTTGHADELSGVRGL